MTLGNAAAAHVRLIVWCRDCGHRVEPAPAEMASRYGSEISRANLTFNTLDRGRTKNRKTEVVLSMGMVALFVTARKWGNRA
jgi:hypothetical protein